MQKKHSHQFHVVIPSTGGMLGKHEVHRFTHRHYVDLGQSRLAHSHSLGDFTDGARYYDEVRGG